MYKIDWFIFLLGFTTGVALILLILAIKGG